MSKIVFQVESALYYILEKCSIKSDWEFQSNDGLSSQTWDVLWTDSCRVIYKTIKLANESQRINHFCNSEIFYKKDKLARSLQKMEYFCNEMDYTPKTWVLPLDYKLLTNFLKDGQIKKWIVVKSLVRV
jgi:hypothetical protein